MSELIEQALEWMNANEGVLAGVGVLIALITIMVPRFRALLTGRPALPGSIDPKQLPLHPAYIAALTGENSEAEHAPAGSFFAPNRRARARAVQRPHYTDPGRAAVAIFPFDCAVEGKGLNTAASAIADEISTGLTATNGYDVISGRVTRGFEGSVSDLGARYLVEGTLRLVSNTKQGECVRIIARLVDVGTGRHVWAERFECPLAEFDHQEDEIASQITAALIANLQNAEIERASQADPKKLDAWSLSMLAFSSITGAATRENVLQAEKLARRAVERDDNSGYAHMVLSATLVQKRGFVGEFNLKVDEAEIREHAERAIELAPRDSMTLALYGFVRTSLDEAIDALPYLERSVEASPSNARAWGTYGRALRNAGRVDEAVPKFERAIRLAPKDVMVSLWWIWLASCFLLQERFEEAIDSARKAVTLNRSFFWGWLIMAAALGNQGRTIEAEEAIDEVRSYFPDLDKRPIRELLESSLGSNVDLSVLIKGLEGAGLETAITA